MQTCPECKLPEVLCYCARKQEILDRYQSDLAKVIEEALKQAHTTAQAAGSAQYHTH